MAPPPTDSADPGQDQAEERVPFMQGILDNHFLLLFIGVVVPAVFYTIWGIMDIVMIPVAR